MRSIQIDPYSATVVRLALFRDDRELAVGSGFLWRHQGSLFIVTAWHCLTGTNFLTRQSISSTGSRPNRLRATFLSNTLGFIHIYNHELLASDACPSWFVHSAGSHIIDLAFIPLVEEPASEALYKAINDLPNDPIRLEVGCDLFIVGFPDGVSRLNLPIWKRGSLAIDPMAVIDDENARYLIIDSASRKGMSGSPVFLRQRGVYVGENGVVNLNAISTKFIGVYTGRLSTSDPLGAQLGIVWPRTLVEEMIDKGIRDPFV